VFCAHSALYLCGLAMFSHLLGFSLGGVEHIIRRTPGDSDGKRQKLSDDQAKSFFDPKQMAKFQQIKGKQPTTNPQTAVNLVLGTWAVNSHMYQAEMFLSTALDKAPAGTEVTLGARVRSLMQKRKGATYVRPNANDERDSIIRADEFNRLALPDVDMNAAKPNAADTVESWPTWSVNKTK
jgi:hypothetical protein